jgi:uncharacterized protein YlaN (UPF0358 family)
MPDLYEKILNVIIVLKDTRDSFLGYSAQDIKKLIKAKLEAKTLKEPMDLGKLYELERMISELREAFTLSLP